MQRVCLPCSSRKWRTRASGFGSAGSLFLARKLADCISGDREEAMQAADAQSDKAGKTPWAAFAGIIATVSVFAISQGLSYPLLSFILQREGVSPALIGASAAMTPLGFIISSPLIPWMSRKFGAGRLAVGCAGAAALVLALIALVHDVWWWFPLRFLLGFAANPLYVVSETWMIAIAPPEKRGRLMGVYTSIVSAGFALGPLTLAIVGTEGWPPFLVGIIAFLICGLILLAILPRLPAITDEEHATSVAGFARLAPLLLLAVFVAAAFEQSLLALISVYGQAYGSPESRIASLLTVFIAGNIALQIPFGALAERIGWQATMLLCTVTALTGCMLLPPLFDTLLIWPVAFIWGGGCLLHLHHGAGRARRALFGVDADHRQRSFRAVLGHRRHRRSTADGSADRYRRRTGPAARQRAAVCGSRHGTGRPDDRRAQEEA
jgi:MFS family permease